jgi:hypothetical protein
MVHDARSIGSSSVRRSDRALENSGPSGRAVQVLHGAVVSRVAADSIDRDRSANTLDGCDGFIVAARPATTDGRYSRRSVGRRLRVKTKT